jgi:hypothetical protein
VLVVQTANSLGNCTRSNHGYVLPGSLSSPLTFFTWHSLHLSLLETLILRILISGFGIPSTLLLSLCFTLAHSLPDSCLSLLTLIDSADSYRPREVSTSFYHLLQEADQTTFWNVVLRWWEFVQRFRCELSNTVALPGRRAGETAKTRFARPSSNFEHNNPLPQRPTIAPQFKPHLLDSFPPRCLPFLFTLTLLRGRELDHRVAARAVRVEAADPIRLEVALAAVTNIADQNVDLDLL